MLGEGRNAWRGDKKLSLSLIILLIFLVPLLLDEIPKRMLHIKRRDRIPG